MTKKFILIVGNVLIGAAIFAFFFLIESFYFKNKNQKKLVVNNNGLVIACLGDSVSSDYPDMLGVRLAKKLTPLPVRISKLLKPGATTEVILKLLQKDIEKTKPKIVIVMTGINDSNVIKPLPFETPKRKNGLIYSANNYSALLDIFLSKLYLMKSDFENYISNVNLNKKQRLNEVRKKLSQGRYDFVVSEMNKLEKETGPANFEEFIIYKTMGERNKSIKSLENFISQNKTNQINSYDVRDINKALKVVGDYELSMRFNQYFNINEERYVLYYSQELWKSGHLDSAKIAVLPLLGNEAVRTQATFILGSILIQQNRCGDIDTTYKNVDIEARKLLRLACSRLVARVKNQQPPDTEEKKKMLKYVFDKLIEMKKTYGFELVVMQYPLQDIKALKELVSSKEDIYFVDNEKIFKDAIAKYGYQKIFVDYSTEGDGMHLGWLGQQLLVDNIEETLITKVFPKLKLQTIKK